VAGRLPTFFCFEPRTCRDLPRRCASTAGEHELTGILSEKLNTEMAAKKHNRHKIKIGNFKPASILSCSRLPASFRKDYISMPGQTGEMVFCPRMPIAECSIPRLQ
jgi:hypothetical protein